MKFVCVLMMAVALVGAEEDSPANSEQGRTSSGGSSGSKTEGDGPAATRFFGGLGGPGYGVNQGLGSTGYGGNQGLGGAGFGVNPGLGGAGFGVNPGLGGAGFGVNPGLGGAGFGVNPGFGGAGFGVNTGLGGAGFGVNPGYNSGLSGINPGIGSVAPPSQCRYWCRTPEGQAYCCENKNQPQSNAYVVKPGRCPPVRPVCPPVRSFAPPASCSNDGACGGVDKCCYDKCLEQHTCKAPLGYGR